MALKALMLKKRLDDKKKLLAALRDGSESYFGSDGFGTCG